MRINEGSGELIMIDVRLFLEKPAGIITGQLPIQDLEFNGPFRKSNRRCLVPQYLFSFAEGFKGPRESSCSTIA